MGPYPAIIKKWKLLKALLWSWKMDGYTQLQLKCKHPSVTVTISISGKIAELHWYKDTASAAKNGLWSVKYIVMPKLLINVHCCPLVYLLCVDKAFTKVWYDANGTKPVSFWTAEFPLYPHRPHDNQLDKPIVVCWIFFFFTPFLSLPFQVHTNWRWTDTEVHEIFY